MNTGARVIAHVDMDAFFAAVEQRDNPELRGKPVLVGGSAKRGVVTAASYEARPFGVHSAMPMARALRLCPQAVVLPGRMAAYAEASGRIMDVFRSFTPLVEPLSLDEAFLDLTGAERLHGPAREAALAIKRRIREETELTASVGIGPAKFIAKIASDLGKPDGLVEVRPEEVDAFLTPLPIERLWGVGRKTAPALHALGIRTIADLRAYPATVIEERFGALGTHMLALAWGRDAREVVPDEAARSIGAEETFAEDIAEAEVLEARLLEIAERVGRRLRRAGVVGHTVTLKIKYADFRLISRSRTFETPTDLTRELWTAACVLLREKVDLSRPVRLAGIQVSHLLGAEDQEADLFEPEIRRKEARLERGVDAIRERFGRGAVVRATLLEREAEDEDVQKIDRREE